MKPSYENLMKSIQILEKSKKKSIKKVTFFLVSLFVSK